MSGAIFDTIPYRYAGQKAAPGDEDVFTHEGQHYRINNGYYIPYYARKNGEPIERRSEELVVDRCRKFFHMAEPDIDLMWSREAIEAQMKRVQAATNEREKAAEARMLVGAMVNRIERLARVFLQKGSLIGTRIDLTDAQKEGIKSITKDDDTDTIRIKLEKLASEFEEYYGYLTAEPPDGHADLTRCVRLRDYSRDNDDLLLDFVRDTMKGFLNLDSRLAERETYSGVINKIGWAQENIDQLHTRMKSVLKVNNAMPLLTSAHHELYGENTSYLESLQEFVDVARARTCIKSEDYESFAPVLARLGVLEERLHTTHSAMRMTAREGRDIEAQQVRDLLDQGIKLIMRCAEARTPINEHSPHAGGIESITEAEKRTQSSTGKFEAAVTALESGITTKQPITKQVRDSLPKVAPATWKNDKLRGDTPPDFIKRHYGQWLREDATGLTRPDLRRLDPTIYMALTNFMRNHKLPSDCPLPNKSEVIEREMTQPTPSPDELSLKDYWRLRSRQRARNLPEK